MACPMEDDDDTAFEALVQRTLYPMALADSDTTKRSEDPTPSYGVEASPVGTEDQHASPSSSLWYLSMIQHDNALMYTTARLYLHLTSTYERKRGARLSEWRELRQRHEAELSRFLQMADMSDFIPKSTGSSREDDKNTKTKNSSAEPKQMVVESQWTESVFQRHAQEVERLTARHREEAYLAEWEANHNLQSFLRVAAPDHLKHALATRDGQNNSAANIMASPSVLHPHHQASVSDFIVHPIVDTLVLQVVNPLRGHVVGARPKDPALAAIVLECSPLQRLGDCNALSAAASSHVDEDHQERMARKVQDHLTRLAAARHSMLLIIGSRAEALRALGCDNVDDEAEWDAPSAGSDDEASAKRPLELILPLQRPLRAGGVQRLPFAPIRGTHLAAATTSALYAGNIVLHLETGVDAADDIAATVRQSLRDTLHIGLTTGVTRLSVAVLPSMGQRMFRNDLGDDDATRSPVLSGNALVLDVLHRAVAHVQMGSTCGKPASMGGMHVSGLLHGLSEWHSTPPPITTCVSRTPFNLSMAVRVFLDVVPLEAAAAEAFDRDVEVIGRTV